MAAWEVIKANSNTEPAPWVSIGVHNKVHGLQMKIHMSKTVVAHLGVKNGERVMVQRGSGDHSGWIQIRKSPPWFDRGMTLTNRKTANGNLAFRVTAGHFGLSYHKTVKITTNDASLILTRDGDGPVIQLEIPAGFYSSCVVRAARGGEDE